MSKIKLPLRRKNLVLLFLSLHLSIFAREDKYVGDFSHSEIAERLDALSTDIDFKLTNDVKKYLDQFVVHYKHSSETLIGRSLYYFPLIEEKILQKDIPLEIRNLVIIESSLNPSARSRAGATGLWQFMRTTGRMYGLKIDNVIDERRDPEKSTEAALTYLSDLHERFGDWTLALAAYNCGPGNVRKAMRRSGGKDYWSIRNYLPKETRNYIPKFIAATYMMNYYSDHGIIPKYPDELFTHTRAAILEKKTSFLEISKITGLEVEVIKWYNPIYVGAYLPKSETGSELILPSAGMYSLLDSMDAFHCLVPDQMQDMKEETKVASQVLERKGKLANIAELKGIDGILANLEAEHLLDEKRSEIKLTISVIRHAESQSLLLNEIPRHRKRKNEKRKFTYRKEKATIGAE